MARITMWITRCLDGMDAAMAIHMMNEIPEGTFSIEAGPRMASCTDFTLTVHGTATHGSMPHLGHDAIVAASAVIMNLQTLVSRQHTLVRFHRFRPCRFAVQYRGG